MFQRGFLPLHCEGRLDILGTLGGIDGAEEDVHILELHLLRLGNEEYDEERHGKAENAEHDEGAPADVGNGDGRYPGDHVVE